MWKLLYLEEYLKLIITIFLEEKLKFEEIYALKDSDKYAKETFDRLIIYFKGLSNVVNILDPEVIVLGGV